MAFAIEKQLELLFEEQKKKKHLKGCLFNLIIFSGNKERIKFLRSLVQAIINKFPCRILFIECDPEGPPNQFTVAVSSQVSGSVACDQIAIVSSPKRLEEVPFVILPHFVPDLPIYLLWGEDPTLESPLFASLIKYIDRLIFDSDCVDDLHRFSCRLLEHMKLLPHEFMDIRWALLKGWRKALADVFDTSERVENLYCLSEIHIFYNAPLETDSLFFQAWLMSSLGSKFLKMEMIGPVRILHYEGRRIFLHPEKRQESPGAIFAIEMATAAGESYSMRKREGERKIVVHISDQEKCEMPFTLPLPDFHRGLTFVKEVFFSPPSLQYQKMLNYVQALPL